MAPVIKVCDLATGEVQALWGDSKGKREAMIDAQARRPGGGRITPGDILDMTHTEDRTDPQNPNKQAEKIYRIDVTPGDPLVAQTTNGHPQQNVAPQPPMPAPSHAPAPPPPQPARAGGFTQPPPF
jgi:hypothetical protein